MAKHRHRIKTTRTVGYRSTARGCREENRRAHGNICQIDTCACGAVRETNVNAGVKERGAWFAPAPAEAPRAHTREPVTTGGWYENTDGSVTRYHWDAGRLLTGETVAGWAHVPSDDDE